MSGKRKTGYDQGEVQMSSDAIQIEEEKNQQEHTSHHDWLSTLGMLLHVHCYIHCSVICHKANYRSSCYV